MAHEYSVKIQDYISLKIAVAEEKNKELIMSYVYLLDIHKLIDQRLAEASQSIETTENDPGKTKFREGQIDILSDYKEFLIDNLNPKLPRAIRKKFI
ncbi:MAG: hypothetical protein JRJ15_11550 [Deltaproteobacteria bacterium]|nr:hypothetical protein [Deltaproteobacteria bacterium]